MTTYRQVVIDYGHGGFIDEDGDGKPEYQTAGKQYHFRGSPHGPDWSFYEGVFNRRVAAQLIGMLLAEGYEVHDAVAGRRVTAPLAYGDLEQNDIPLSRRVAYANSLHETGILVSIHGNAVGNSSVGPGEGARGFIVFTSKGYSRSDPIATSVFEAFERILAGEMRVRRDSTDDNDPDYERNFYVLRKSRGAAILTENGFFTSYPEAKFMWSEEGVTKIAQAHFEGLKPHLQR